MDAAPPKKQNPNLVRELWSLLKYCPPQDYRQKLVEIMERLDCEPDRALVFPLSKAMENNICNMAHEIPEAPGYKRDARLMTWFQTCVDLGANPKIAIEGLKEPSSGLSRLIHMKAFECLHWWRAQGVEETLKGPTLLGGEPTTLATLAFLQGSIVGVEQLLPTSYLTHHDKLWHQVFSRLCVKHADGLLAILRPLSPPPADCFLALAKSPVNLSNVAKIIEGARFLNDHGITTNAPEPGRPAPLAALVRNMNSPASLQVLEYLLELGADPLAPARAGKDDASIVEVALQQWLQCTPRSHLRKPRMQCFIRLAEACPANILFEFFTPERQAQIEDDIRATEAKDKAFPVVNRTSGWSAGPEIAMLQAWWITLYSKPAASARSRPRF